ncbi:MAG: hypothetical protein R3E68_04320 [Burkholderiaceae bacterium]
MAAAQGMRVGIFGLGTIGREVARRLHQGIEGLVLAGASARDQHKATVWLGGGCGAPSPMPGAWPIAAT